MKAYTFAVTTSPLSHSEITMPISDELEALRRGSLVRTKSSRLSQRVSEQGMIALDCPETLAARQKEKIRRAKQSQRDAQEALRKGASGSAALSDLYRRLLSEQRDRRRRAEFHRKEWRRTHPREEGGDGSKGEDPTAGDADTAAGEEGVASREALSVLPEYVVEALKAKYATDDAAAALERALQEEGRGGDGGGALAALMELPPEEDAAAEEEEEQEAEENRQEEEEKEEKDEEGEKEGEEAEGAEGEEEKIVEEALEAPDQRETVEEALEVLDRMETQEETAEEEGKGGAGGEQGPPVKDAGEAHTQNGNIEPEPTVNEENGKKERTEGEGEKQEKEEEEEKTDEKEETDAGEEDVLQDAPAPAVVSEDEGGENKAETAEETTATEEPAVEPAEILAVEGPEQDNAAEAKAEDDQKATTLEAGGGAPTADDPPAGHCDAFLAYVHLHRRKVADDPPALLTLGDGAAAGSFAALGHRVLAADNRAAPAAAAPGAFCLRLDAALLADALADGGLDGLWIDGERCSSSGTTAGEAAALRRWRDKVRPGGVLYLRLAAGAAEEGAAARAASAAGWKVLESGAGEGGAGTFAFAVRGGAGETAPSSEAVCGDDA